MTAVQQVTPAMALRANRLGRYVEISVRPCLTSALSDGQHVRDKRPIVANTMTVVVESILCRIGNCLDVARWKKKLSEM
jgi:hypothetical protein